MEWDLDPQDAQSFRDEASQTIRLRIKNTAITNSATSTPSTTCRPKLGERCLVELQGELLLPELSKSESKQQLHYHNQQHRKVAVSPGGETETSAVSTTATKTTKPVSFKVGVIEEENPATTKSKATLKIGTLFIDGERMKITNPALVVVDKIIVNTNNNETTEKEKAKQQRRTREGEEVNSNEQEEENNSNNSNFLLKNQQSNENDEQQEQEEQELERAPPISEWISDVSSDLLIATLNEQEREEEQAQANSSSSSSYRKKTNLEYEVVGSLVQKYLFKAKPMRVMRS